MGCNPTGDLWCLRSSCGNTIDAQSIREGSNLSVHGGKSLSSHDSTRSERIFYGTRKQKYFDRGERKQRQLFKECTQGSDKDKLGKVFIRLAQEGQTQNNLSKVSSIVGLKCTVSQLRTTSHSHADAKRIVANLPSMFRQLQGCVRLHSFFVYDEYILRWLWLAMKGRRVEGYLQCLSRSGISLGTLIGQWLRSWLRAGVYGLGPSDEPDVPEPTATKSLQ